MKGGAPCELLEMRTLIVDRRLLDTPQSIGKTSFDHIEINRPTNNCANLAGSGSATGPAGASGNVLDQVWKTTQRLSGRVDVTGPVETSAEQKQRCQRVVRIDGESSQFGLLRILPHPQRVVGHSDIGRDPGVARVELLRSLRIGQRALPFTTPAI